MSALVLLLLERCQALSGSRQFCEQQDLLVDVIAIAVCGVIVICDGPTAIRLWALEREPWLRGFLESTGAVGAFRNVGWKNNFPNNALVAITSSRSHLRCKKTCGRLL